MMFIDGNSYAYLRSILFFIFRYFGNGETSRKACKQNNRQTINDKNVMHTQKRNVIDIVLLQPIKKPAGKCERRGKSRHACRGE